MNCKLKCSLQSIVKPYFSKKSFSQNAIRWDNNRLVKVQTKTRKERHGIIDDTNRKQILSGRQAHIKNYMCLI